MAAIDEAKVKIRSALKGRLNGVNSAQIRESAGISTEECKRAISAMKKAGELLCHEGESPRKTRYSLSALDTSGKAEGARTSVKSRKGSRKPHRAGVSRRFGRRSTNSAPRTELVAALTVDNELLLVDRHASGVPQIFTPEDTASIASLLGHHFE